MWISKFEPTIYPIITSQSLRIVDILDNLQGARLQIPPELNRAVQELDAKIKSIQIFVEKGNFFLKRVCLRVISNKIHLVTRAIKSGIAKATEQTLDRLVQKHEEMNATAKNYEMLLESLISFFKNLEEVKDRISYIFTLYECIHLRLEYIYIYVYKILFVVRFLRSNAKLIEQSKRLDAFRVLQN